MKTVEELLMPRYKVIAKDTSGNLKVGEVLLINRAGFTICGVKAMAPSMLDEYPHLFQRLPWWAERDVEDMPEFVKYIGSGGNVSELTKPMIDAGGIVMEDYLPATLAEYETFIQSKKL